MVVHALAASTSMSTRRLSVWPASKRHPACPGLSGAIVRGAQQEDIQAGEPDFLSFTRLERRIAQRAVAAYLMLRGTSQIST